MFSEAVLGQAVAKVRAALAAVVPDPTVIEADRLTLVRAWAAVTLCVCMCNVDDDGAAASPPKIPLQAALLLRALAMAWRARVSSCVGRSVPLSRRLPSLCSCVFLPPAAMNTYR